MFIATVSVILSLSIFSRTMPYKTINNANISNINSQKICIRNRYLPSKREKNVQNAEGEYNNIDFVSNHKLYTRDNFSIPNNVKKITTNNNVINLEEDVLVLSSDNILSTKAIKGNNRKIAKKNANKSSSLKKGSQKKIDSNLKNKTKSKTQDKINKKILTRKELENNRKKSVNKSEKEILRELVNRIHNGEADFVIYSKNTRVINKYNCTLRYYLYSEGLDICITYQDDGSARIKIKTYYGDRLVTNQENLAYERFLNNVLKKISVDKADIKNTIYQIRCYQSINLPYKKIGKITYDYDTMVKNGGGTCGTYVNMQVAMLRKMNKVVYEYAYETRGGGHAVLGFYNNNSWGMADVTSAAKPARFTYKDTFTINSDYVNQGVYKEYNQKAKDAAVQIHNLIN